MSSSSRCLCLLVVVSVAASLPARATVVGYWRFEEGPQDYSPTGPGAEGYILDSSGNNFVGDARMNPGGQSSGIYRSAVPVANVPMTGQANTLSFEFEGVAEGTPQRDHVRVAQAQNLALLNPPDALTMEFWATFDKLPGDPGEPSEYQIVNKWGGAGSKQWYLKLRNDDKLMWGISRNGQSGAGNAIDVIGNTTIVTGQWYHIAGTYDGQTARLYVDDVQDGSASFATPQQIHGLGPNMLFGTNQGASAGALDGHLDEMRMSNTALLPHQFLRTLPATVSVRNPGAESGTGDGAASRVDGWATIPGDAPVRRSSGIVSIAPHSGSYFFYGGQTALAGAYEEVLPPVPGLSLLAANGLANAHVGGWFASAIPWEPGNPDAARLEMQLLDAGGAVLGTLSTGPQLGSSTAPYWEFVQVEGPVPAGTATGRVRMIIERGSGTNNDGYLDDVSAGFSVIRHTGNLLVNGGAENGDTSGWTDTSPFFEAVTQHPGPPGAVVLPHSGAYFFRAGANAANQMYQDVDVSSYAGPIDEGLAFGLLDLWMTNATQNDDQATVDLQFLDGLGVLLGSATTGPQTDFPPYQGGTGPFGSWAEFALGAFLPLGTRSVRIVLDATRLGGTNNDAYFDSADFRLYFTPEPTSAILLALGIVGLARRRRRRAA